RHGGGHLHAGALLQPGADPMPATHATILQQADRIRPSPCETASGHARTPNGSDSLGGDSGNRGGTDDSQGQVLGIIRQNLHGQPWLFGTVYSSLNLASLRVNATTPEIATLPLPQK